MNHELTEEENERLDALLKACVAQIEEELAKRPFDLKRLEKCSESSE